MSRYTRRTEEESENTHHWLLTYSDVVTLCLTFFVLLYSFSTLDAYKWKSLISSLRGALGVLDGGNIPLDDSVFGNANLVEEKEIVIWPLAYLPADIQEGDILCFHNAGAYCFSMTSNYNSRFKPAEVLVYNEQTYLIRKHETFKDLLHNQILVDLD